MNWISENDIKAIRQQADIVDIISRYVPLEKKGKEYRGQCPFHDDHDPSMHVSTDKQIFKCFVCGTGGNVFSFVQKIENISYLEAIIKVAEMIHYPLDVSKFQSIQKVDPNQKLYDCLNSYIFFTNYELNSDNGAFVRDYLMKRKIHDDIIKRFEIGYAPDSIRSIKYLKAKGFDESIMIRSGLANAYNEQLRAVFANRLMIPIHDEHGRPVGFTARRLSENEEEAKYINTGQTDIYIKGNLIFNYHRAKKFARKNHRCILVEGAMDVLAFEKADIHESVACLGTAFTNEQLSLLKRLNVPLTICYDGDKAGKTATYKFGRAAMDQGISFSVVKNVSGKDPDEIFNEYGKDELFLTVHKTISFVEFLLEYLPNQYDLDNYEDKKMFVHEMQSCIQRLCTDFEKADYYARIKEMTGFDLSIQRQDSIREKKVSPKIRPSFIELPKKGRSLAEYGVLYMILQSKKAANIFKDEIGFFKDPLCEEVSLYCFDQYRMYDQIDIDILLVQPLSDGARNLLVTLISDPFHLGGFNLDFLNDSILKIRECSIQDQIDALNEKIKDVQDPLLKIELASKKQALIVERNTILHRKEV